ncbi:MAG TPA: hypothetical protein VN804_00920, partial [Solirubrobacteraceae bacterium]|nr:hypothetical protein [Solirubrobacteraceae bacterium]
QKTGPHAGRSSIGRSGTAHAPSRQLAHAPAGTAASTTQNGADGPKSKAKAKPKGPSKNRLSEQQKAERAIEAAEAAMAELEHELADPAAWASKYEAAKSEARHTAAKRAVEQAYERLEALVD